MVRSFVVRVCGQDVEWKRLRDTKTQTSENFARVRATRQALFFGMFDYVHDKIDEVYKELTRSERYPMGGSASIVLANREDPFSGLSQPTEPCDSPVVRSLYTHTRSPVVLGTSLVICACGAVAGSMCVVAAAECLALACVCWLRWCGRRRRHPVQCHASVEALQRHGQAVWW